MVADQLLGNYDDISSSTASGTIGSSIAGDGNGNAGSSDGGSGGGGGGSPAQVCSLLAHLLLLAAGGGLGQATALSDTFGEGRRGRGYMLPVRGRRMRVGRQPGLLISNAGLLQTTDASHRSQPGPAPVRARARLQAPGVL